MQETWLQTLGQQDPLEKGREPTPVFLPRAFHGQRSLAGYSPCDWKESNTTTTTMWIWGRNKYSVRSNSPNHTYSLTCCLQASFLLQHQGWVEAAESTWPVKPGRSASLPFAGTVCWPLASEMAEVHGEKAACCARAVVLMAVTWPLHLFTRSLPYVHPWIFLHFVCSIPLIQPLSSYVLLSGAKLYMFLLDPDAVGVSHLKALYLPIKQGGDRCHYLPVSGQTRDSPGSSSFEVWCRSILPFTQHLEVFEFS